MDFTTSRQASRVLSALDPERIDHVLRQVAQAVSASKEALLAANAKDCASMSRDDARYDRLQLTSARIDDVVSAIETVAQLPSPLGRVLDSVQRPNGLLINKVSVPFGVIGVIFEARPNVVFDVFALCFKAGSACLVKGGHEAASTTSAAVEIIRQTLESEGLPSDLLCSVDGREGAEAMMQARGQIDLLIPRGGRKLIEYVRDNSRVPVIETGAGVCHTYFHSSGDVATGRDIIFNAKTRRPGVCNALDCVIVDSSRLADLPALFYPLSEKKVEIHADERSYAALRGAYPYLCQAAEDDYGREWLSCCMTVVTVDSLDEALDFIERYGSRHSECIVAESRPETERFLNAVDAACVYANVSTAFTDGGQFGMGAEIGISTQKLHARGPMALRELCTYKYRITGAGQIRN